jgi:hypothetical protein
MFYPSARGQWWILTLRAIDPLYKYLLASFRRPHFTVRLGTIDDLPRLLAALGRAEPNPYHGRRPGRR